MCKLNFVDLWVLACVAKIFYMPSIWSCRLVVIICFYIVRQCRTRARNSLARLWSPSRSPKSLYLLPIRSLPWHRRLRTGWLGNVLTSLSLRISDRLRAQFRALSRAWHQRLPSTLLRQRRTRSWVRQPQLTKPRKRAWRALWSGYLSSRPSSLIRLKRIYNFLCFMLVFTPFAYYFVTLRGTFMHFPELTY
jgi:hypothetical protein